MDQLVKATAPRIALLGLFGSENIGNEASLDQMVFALREEIPSAQLWCICAIPDAVVRRHRIRAVGLSPPRFKSVLARAINKLLLRIPARLVQFRAALREVRNADFVIVPGTGALDDFGWSPFRYPLNFALWCVAARMRGVKLLFVSIGAGPIAHPISRFFLKTAARCAAHRSYRDLASKSYMASIGVESSTDRIYPDLVFATPVPDERPAVRDRVRVALGVMTYFGWSGDPKKGAGIRAAYLSTLSAFAGWLIARGFEVRLIVGERSDEAAVKTVLETLTAAGHANGFGQLAAERIENFDDLLKAVAAADIVVATRFHNVVAALMACKPVVSIGYAAKNEVLMAEMGLGDYCQSADDLDLEKLKRQFDQLLVKRGEIGAMLDAHTRAIRARLQEQQQGLQEIITRGLAERRLPRDVRFPAPGATAAD